MNNYEELNMQQTVSEVDPFTKDRYRQFYKFFPKNTCTVLDIGCNTGRGGEVLKSLDHSLKISGLDCVKDRLERLPHGVYDHVIEGLSTDIPSDDCEFDVAVAGEFIEHLYPSHVDMTLAEIFRVLKVGGRLILTTPNPRYIKIKARRLSVLGGAHLSQHFHEALRLRLKMIGYSGIKIYGSGKVTWYIGCRIPFLPIYGSYLIIGDKK